MTSSALAFAFRSFHTCLSHARRTMKDRVCSFLLCTYDAISAVMDQLRRMLEVFELLGVQSKLSSAFYVERNVTALYRLMCSYSPIDSFFSQAT